MKKVEEEEKHVAEVSPDALEAVFEETVLLEEEDAVSPLARAEDEDEEGVDIAFLANDEGYW